MFSQIAQILGLLGAAMLMLSFQADEAKNFFRRQALGSGLFLIHYFMLGAYTGVVVSVMSVTRTIVIARWQGKRKTLSVLALIVFSVVAMFFIYTGYETILMTAAYVILTLAMNLKNSKIIRLTQLAIVSPLQLIYNILVFSIGGIVCESFNILSILVSIKRLGLDNFKDSEEL